MSQTFEVGDRVRLIEEDFVYSVGCEGEVRMVKGADIFVWWKGMPDTAYDWLFYTFGDGGFTSTIFHVSRYLEKICATSDMWAELELQ